MARARRVELAGGFFHLYARGNNRGAIFLSDDDRVIYLLLLADVIERCGWNMLAWCLMPNHVHLVVETPEENLGAGMHRLQGNYALGFNQRHGRINHLFGDRYRNPVIVDDDHLWTVVRYVVRNPVRAAMVEQPGDYPWSSHRLVAAGSPTPLVDVPRLLDLFSVRGGDPLERYLRFVERPQDPG